MTSDSQKMISRFLDSHFCIKFQISQPGWYPDQAIKIRHLSTHTHTHTYTHTSPTFSKSSTHTQQILTHESYSPPTPAPHTHSSNKNNNRSTKNIQQQQVDNNEAKIAFCVNGKTKKSTRLAYKFGSTVHFLSDIYNIHTHKHTHNKTHKYKKIFF